MPQDTPPESDSDEISCAYLEDDEEVLFEIIDDEMIQSYDVPEDNSDATFSGHTDGVLCCNLNKSGDLVCSGGLDDKAFIWNPVNGGLIYECKGHKDSVVSAVFNYNASLLATGDLDGFVQVWDVENMSNIWNFTASSIGWMDWLHDKNVLIAGTADGECWLWSIIEDNTAILPSYGTEVTCGYIMPDGKRCVVGYENGSVRIWDMEEASIIGQLQDPIHHKKCVTSIKYQPNNDLLLSGSVDGTAKLFKSSNCEILWNINCTDEDTDTSVECVDFVYGHPFLATGTNTGVLSIWDISTKVQRSCCSFEGSIIKLICDPTTPVIYTADKTGFIKLFDARSGNEERTWSGHKADVLDFVLSEGRDKIVTASEDGLCKVFKVAQS